MTLAPTPAHDGGEDVFNGIIISATDTRVFASLAMRLRQDDAFEKAAKKLFGCPLPGPDRTERGGPYSMFQTGQAQWLVMSDMYEHEAIADKLKTAFGTTASITDQTGGTVAFQAVGPRVPAMMERLTMLDTACMKEGDVARTLIHHMSVTLWKGHDGFEFFGPRSMAGSLHHALVTAARSVA